MSYFIKYGCGENTEKESPALHSCQVIAETHTTDCFGGGGKVRKNNHFNITSQVSIPERDGLLR